MQLGGGVGQGLLEPAGRRLGLLRAGAIARRGRPQQIGGQRGVAAEPGHVQRRGQHRPRVRVRGPGVLPPGDQLGRGRQGLGQPVPGRPQRDRQPPVTGRGRAGPVLLGGAERLADADDVGQVQHLAFPLPRVRVAGRGHRGVSLVPVRPQRADDHDRGPGLQQRAHHAAGQPVLAVQVALQLIQPHHRPRRRRLGQRGDLVRPGRVHQPPLRQQRLDRLDRAAGLADRGPADQQHEPARPRRGLDPGPDPELGSVNIPQHIPRRVVVGYARDADRRVHPQPPWPGVPDPYPARGPGQVGGTGPLPGLQPRSLVGRGDLAHGKEREQLAPGGRPLAGDDLSHRGLGQRLQP